MELLLFSSDLILLYVVCCRCDRVRRHQQSNVFILQADACAATTHSRSQIQVTETSKDTDNTQSISDKCTYIISHNTDTLSGNVNAQSEVIETSTEQVQEVETADTGNSFAEYLEAPDQLELEEIQYVLEEDVYDSGSEMIYLQVKDDPDTVYMLTQK